MNSGSNNIPYMVQMTGITLWTLICPACTSSQGPLTRSADEKEETEKREKFRGPSLVTLFDFARWFNESITLTKNIHSVIKTSSTIHIKGYIPLLFASSPNAVVCRVLPIIITFFPTDTLKRQTLPAAVHSHVLHRSTSFKHIFLFVLTLSHCIYRPSSAISSRQFG